MSNSKKGLKIGHYRITPLGIGAFAVLIAIIAAAAVLLVSSLGQAPDAQSGDALLANANTEQPANTLAMMMETTAAPTEVPTPTPVPLRSATIRSLGEIAMETDLLKAAADRETKTFDFSEMFSLIADVMGDADYTVADVEGTLGDTASYSGSGTMITPSALLTALKSCGVDMLMLANDHAMDGGFEEQQATVSNVVAAGLDYVGAGTSAEEMQTPVIKSINGIQVGFVAYADEMLSNDKNTYGVKLISSSDIDADVKAARDAGADVVIAYVSWGKMLSRSVTKSQQQIALKLVTAGVDVIIGYNPHMTQPALWLEAPSSDGTTTNRTLCLCSVGNFLSNQREQYADSGVIFQFTIQEQADGSFAIENPLYIPTYVCRYEDEDGLYQYRTLAAGQWTEDDINNLPEGVSYADLQRMGEVWAEMQQVIGADVASIARE